MGGQGTQWPLGQQPCTPISQPGCDPCFACPLQQVSWPPAGQGAAQYRPLPVMHARTFGDPSLTPAVPVAPLHQSAAAAGGDNVWAGWVPASTGEGEATAAGMKEKLRAKQAGEGGSAEVKAEEKVKEEELVTREKQIGSGALPPPLQLGGLCRVPCCRRACCGSSERCAAAGHAAMRNTQCRPVGLLLCSPPLQFSQPPPRPPASPPSHLQAWLAHWPF